jgi:hypothetical protein
MNTTIKKSFWMLSALLCTTILSAQDDLYYDPSTDARSTTRVSTSAVDDNNYSEAGNLTRRYDADNNYYEDDDDYAYEYSSRIRRFHNPTVVADYYDPVFVDMYFYDPFFSPGTSIYLGGYNDYWTWRRWRRWQRWNTWNAGWYDYGWGCNSWGWNSWGWNNAGWNGWGCNNGWGWGWNNGWNSWNNVYVFNNYYYDPYWTWNGWNPYYNNWNNGWNNGWDHPGGGGGGFQPQTYTGVRRQGTTVNPGYARINTDSRLTATTASNGPVLDPRGSRPNGRTSIAAEPAQQQVNSRDVSREVPNNGGITRTPIDGRNNTTTAPSRSADAPRSNDSDRFRPSRPAEAPVRSSDTPNRRAESTPQRDTRTPETTRRWEPTRSTEQRQPSRAEEPRPTRRAESTPQRNDDAYRRSNDSFERSNRSETRSTPRSESPRYESAPSRSGGGDSGRSSGGGNSGGGRSGGGGGGRGGRN